MIILEIFARLKATILPLLVRRKFTILHTLFVRSVLNAFFSKRPIAIRRFCSSDHVDWAIPVFSRTVSFGINCGLPPDCWNRATKILDWIALR